MPDRPPDPVTAPTPEDAARLSEGDLWREVKAIFDDAFGSDFGAGMPALRGAIFRGLRKVELAGFAAALSRAAGELDLYAFAAGDTFDPRAVMRKMAAHLRELAPLA